MTYTAIHLSGTELHDFTMSGFETEELAWEYVAFFRCKSCAENNLDTCDAEWMVCNDEN